MFQMNKKRKTELVCPHDESYSRIMLSYVTKVIISSLFFKQIRGNVMNGAGYCYFSAKCPGQTPAICLSMNLPSLSKRYNRPLFL